jgi:hypothetical protein
MPVVLVCLQILIDIYSQAQTLQLTLPVATRCPHVFGEETSLEPNLGCSSKYMAIESYRQYLLSRRRNLRIISATRRRASFTGCILLQNRGLRPSFTKMRAVSQPIEHERIMNEYTDGFEARHTHVNECVEFSWSFHTSRVP